MRTTRVLLADDHEAILAAAAAVLEGEFQVVGSVRDGTALLVAAAELKPDIVVLDISMPLLHGFQVARELCRTHPQPRIVFLTVHEDADFARAAFAAGGLCYVVKSRLAADLIPALRAAVAGEVFLSPTIHLDEAA